MQYGMTPLLAAAATNYVSVVRVLIAFGASFTLPSPSASKSTRNALNVAIAHEQSAICETLVRCGFPLHDTNSNLSSKNTTITATVNTSTGAGVRTISNSIRDAIERGTHVLRTFRTLIFATVRTLSSGPNRVCPLFPPELWHIVIQYLAPDPFRSNDDILIHHQIAAYLPTEMLATPSSSVIATSTSASALMNTASSAADGSVVGGSVWGDDDLLPSITTATNQPLAVSGSEWGSSASHETSPSLTLATVRFGATSISTHNSSHKPKFSASTSTAVSTPTPIAITAHDLGSEWG
jgi:hypothetical protein